jgi:hypothetical protein
VPGGVTIDWYTASSGGSIVSGGYGVASFAPSVTATKTYYAEARNTATGCVSATRLPVTATVHVVPVITHSGGNASQTVILNTAITPVTYTASNATGIALSSGSFPTGVTGTPNGVVFSISGTPAATGTFNYGVTASHTNGCTSAASSGTVTVVVAPPPDAASTQTWTYGTQTWSDRIIAAPPNCTSTSTLTTSNYTTAEYKVYNGRYYYTWACAYNNRNAFCPSPWRLPVQADMLSLVQLTTHTTLIANWGYGGTAVGANIVKETEMGSLWSSEGWEEAPDNKYYVSWTLYLLSEYTAKAWAGMQLRCVRD